MIIAVNTRLLLPGKMEGIGRFTHETLKIITREHAEHKFLFIFDRPWDSTFIFSSNIIPVKGFPQARHPVLWYLFFERSLPAIMRKHKVDLFLSPDGWLSLRSPVLSLPVIHDLNFLHFPQFIPFTVRQYYHYYFPRFIRKAGRIATVSEYTRSDIMNRFQIPENKIDVVYNGAKGFWPISENNRQGVRNRFTDGKPFFLFVGLIHPRKNIANLLLAYDMFRKRSHSNAKLLIAGEIKWWNDEMQEALGGCTYRDDIIFAGRRSDEEIRELTASALAMVYVSFFEGFGIPVLEAMQSDTPVICSSVSSLPEVGGDAVMYADPFQPESISAAMLKIFHDEKFRRDLIGKAGIQREKFSWEKTANLLWKSIEKCLEK